MDRGSAGPRDAGGTRLERAIVLQLLRGDHEPKWSRAQLASELEAGGAQDDRQEIEQALRSLEGAGVLGCNEQEVWASSASRRLDELELIGV